MTFCARSQKVETHIRAALRVGHGPLMRARWAGVFGHPWRYISSMTAETPRHYISSIIVVDFLQPFIATQSEIHYCTTETYTNTLILTLLIILGQ